MKIWTFTSGVSRLLWKPLIVGLIAGLLITITYDTQQNTKEIKKLQRLHACLLVAHDINLPVNDGLREQCIVDIMDTNGEL